MKNMNILVTGATGFIGTALCEEMVSNGHKVTAVVRPDSLKKSKISKEIQVIELSMENFHKLEGQYDLFYHLAWNGASGEDRNSFAIQNSNIRYTAEAIKAAKKCGCKKFIGAGSQAEYGIVKGICEEDSTVPNPFMMYGASKLASYHMGRILANQLEIEFLWPRIYSVYGVGENEGTLVTYVIKTLLKGEIPQLSDCENMWDFINIHDCTKALRILGENDGCVGVYNVASGNPNKLKHYVENIRDIVCKDGTLDFGAVKRDVSKTYWLEPSIEKLKKSGFIPTVCFKNGIIDEVINLRQILKIGGI